MSSLKLDSSAFLNLIEPDNKEDRANWRKMAKHPIFYPKYNITLDQQRQLAYDRLKMISDNKLISIFDFGTNPRRVFAAHEMCGTIDGSLATKMTVQWNLFGGTCFAFHTQDQKAIIDKIDSMQNVGCFCQTELGYGNNAVKMETTAHYDEKTQEFIIHSPTVMSHKYWITNGACHAHYAVVFAQTYVKGKHEGINIFLVPIRDQNLKEMPGVYIEDMGMKQGCNGVDNAKLVFNKVRVDRKMLLNKICNITPDGKFTHKVQKPRQRFQEVADRLLSGRICIACMANCSAKTCLTIGLKFASNRLTVGPKGESDTPIFKYQLQQNALFPQLAKTVCIQLGLNMVKDNFHEFYIHQKGSHMELVRQCCVIKAISGWNSNVVANTVRERCGGQGYLSINRVSECIDFAHASMTAEGDNSVLIQKVAKEQTNDIVKGAAEHPKMDMEISEIYKLARVDNPRVILNLLKFRQISMSDLLISSMQKKILEEGKPLFDVWMYQLSDTIQNCGLSYGNRLIFERCFNMLNSGAFGPNQQIMLNLVTVYGQAIIEENLGWYVSHKIINFEAAKNFTEIRSEWVTKMAPNVMEIVDGFNIAELFAPIAGDYEAYNAKPNFGEYRAKLQEVGVYKS